MTDLVDGVSVREDVVRPELKAAVDWSLQQLLVRIRRRPKLENPLLYLSEKLSEYSNNFRDAIDDEEREKVKGILGLRNKRRDIVLDSKKTPSGNKTSLSAEDQESIVPYFEQHPYFKHMDRSILAKIASRMVEKNLALGEALCTAGAQAGFAYIVKSGEFGTIAPQPPAKEEATKTGEGESKEAASTDAAETKETAKEASGETKDTAAGESKEKTETASKTETKTGAVTDQPKDAVETKVEPQPTEAFVSEGIISAGALLHGMKVPGTLVVRSETAAVWAISRADFKSIVAEEITQRDEQAIASLKHEGFFKNLDERERKQVLQACNESTFSKGQLIMDEDSKNTDDIYVIKSGVVAFSCNEGTRTLKQGEVFGEEALLYTEETSYRRGEATAMDDETTILAIKRDAFDRMIGPMVDILRRDPQQYSLYEEEVDPQAIIPGKGRQGRRNVVFETKSIEVEVESTSPKKSLLSPKPPRKKKPQQSTPRSSAAKGQKGGPSGDKLREASHFFGSLDSYDRAAVTRTMKMAQHKAGDVIAKKGEAGNVCIFVMSGSITRRSEEGGSDEQVFGPGSVLGVYNLLYPTDWGGDLVATCAEEETVVCWSIDRETYKQRLYDSRKKRYDDYVRYMKVKVLSVLTRQECLTLCQAVSVEIFQVDDVIVNKGSKGEKMYILMQGELESRTTADGEGKKMKKGESFGDAALMGQIAYRCTVKASKKSQVMSIHREHFTRLVGQLKILLTRNSKLYAEYDRKYQKSQYADNVSPLKTKSSDESKTESKR